MGNRCDRVPGTGKKLYLSSVLDLFNREVIAYSLSERPVMEMVNTMLDGAFPKLRPEMLRCCTRIRAGITG